MVTKTMIYLLSYINDNPIQPRHFRLTMKIIYRHKIFYRKHNFLAFVISKTAFFTWIGFQSQKNAQKRHFLW